MPPSGRNRIRRDSLAQIGNLLGEIQNGCCRIRRFRDRDRLDLPVGGGPQQYYGWVIKSPAGRRSRSQVKFWFSALASWQSCRVSWKNAILEDRARKIAGARLRAANRCCGISARVFRSVFTDGSCRSSRSTSAAWARPRIEGSSCGSRRPILPDLHGNISTTKTICPASNQPDAARRAVSRNGRQHGPDGRQGTAAHPRHDRRSLDQRMAEANVVKGDRPASTRASTPSSTKARLISVDPGRDRKRPMKKLLEGDWHIFHFIGHGGVEEAVR